MVFSWCFGKNKKDEDQVEPFGGEENGAGSTDPVEAWTSGPSAPANEQHEAVRAGNRCARAGGQPLQLRRIEDVGRGAANRQQQDHRRQQDEEQEHWRWPRVGGRLPWRRWLLRAQCGHARRQLIR